MTLVWRASICVRVTEELRHADQEFPKQQVDLAWLLAQTFDEGGRRVDAQHLHAALDPPQQGVVLVLTEVMAGAGAQ